MTNPNTLGLRYLNEAACLHVPGEDCLRYAGALSGAPTAPMSPRDTFLSQCQEVGVENPERFCSNIPGAPVLADIATLLCLYAGVPVPDTGEAVSHWRRLFCDGLIDREDAHATVTERGKVYCEAIRSLRLPVQQWRMP